jgi:hypothetical protein
MTAARQLGFSELGPCAGATLSACGLYRYRLWRRWGNGRHMTWLMLNPSTADAEADDPTIRKCVGFARRWGYEAIEVVNLFAWRATDPAALRLVDDPVGSENNAHIEEAARTAPLMVAAWGAGAGAPYSGIRARAEDVFVLLARRNLRCLGRAENGAPRHPLMLKYATPLEPYP